MEGHKTKDPLSAANQACWVESGSRMAFKWTADHVAIRRKSLLARAPPPIDIDQFRANKVLGRHPNPANKPRKHAEG